MTRRKRKKRILFLKISLLLGGLLFLLFYMEQRLVPPLKEISHVQCKSAANRIIDSSAAEILQEMNMEETLFLNGNDDTTGYVANTALINQFCTRFSEKISEQLAELPQERIRIPLGAATRFTLLTNRGPKIPFTLLPMGAAKVDYESEFRSAGINQMNYKIWLQISMELQIVNPLYREKITLNRKIMLADVVFSGKVPEHYFQMSPPDEYLLTE